MKRITIAAVAGVALTGVIGIGVAAAATGTGPGGLISDALSGLVSKGTITQKQADAVEKALEDAQDDMRAERDQMRAERDAEVDSLLTDVLGMTSEELRDQLAAGKTLKEIAGDKAQDLADAYVAQVEAQTKEAVEAGRMTQERADDAVEHAKEHAQEWLDGESDSLGRGLLGFGGRGHGMGGPGGPGGPGGHGRGMGPGYGDHGSDDSATSDTTSTTVWRA